MHSSLKPRCDNTQLEKLIKKTREIMSKVEENLEAEPVVAMKLTQRAMVSHDVSLINLSWIRGPARWTFSVFFSSSLPSRHERRPTSILSARDNHEEWRSMIVKEGMVAQAT